MMVLSVGFEGLSKRKDAALTPVVVQKCLSGSVAAGKSGRPAAKPRQRAREVFPVHHARCQYRTVNAACIGKGRVG
eukprot:1506902-Rhodomonas_salina.5